MDTNEAAAALGTTGRVLRQFLRSPFSTFVAVGSGSRYVFDEARDLPMLRKRFAEWQGGGKPKRACGPAASTKAVRRTPIDQHAKDCEVWIEEGTALDDGRPLPIPLPDIRDPRVLARVRASEAARVETLHMQMVAAGISVLQWSSTVPRQRGRSPMS